MSVFKFLVLSIFLPVYSLADGIFDIDDTFYDIWNSGRHYSDRDMEICSIRQRYDTEDEDPHNINIDDDKDEKHYDNEFGHCMKSRSCLAQGGIDYYSPKCGHFSRCCITKRKCGQTSNAKVSYFTSEGSRKKDSLCTYRVNLQKDVCQVRVDFIQFNLDFAHGIPVENAFDDPFTYECQDSYMTIAGDLNQYKYCGSNTGQHVYLHIGKQDYVTFTINRKENSKGAVKLKVTQLNCGEKRTPKKFEKNSQFDLKYLAPAGCTQYYRHHHGTIYSLGFYKGDNKDTGKIKPSTPAELGISTPPNQYSICIRKPSWSTSITYDTVDVALQNDATKCDNYIYVSGVADKTLNPIYKKWDKPLKTQSPGMYYLYFKNENGGAYFEVTYTVN